MITNLQRDLFFRVLDGRPDLIGLLWIIRQRRDYELILRWLVAHRYTGKELEQWYKSNFAPNPQKMFRHILAHSARPVILSR